MLFQPETKNGTHFFLGIKMGQFIIIQKKMNAIRTAELTFTNNRPSLREELRSGMVNRNHYIPVSDKQNGIIIKGFQINMW
ncbi:MAG: hypothetical protein JRC99_11450 [Deltaproteobacteria bacterium]|nr:hypothetical protein [Deltaproteobacteria bacterium]